MTTSHTASLSQRSLQSTQALRTRMLILPLAASIYCMGLAADLRAQSVQYIEQSQVQAAFTQQELDQMLAPIALYPDALLSQILMASTYPLEVVQAARWSRAHPGLSGDDAVRAVANQDWDPSVKSMVAFPQILSMMDERLDWMRRLGDAFLDQEPQVMETVQTLRQRAYAAGNLNSDAQVRVVRQERIILVEPVNPQVIYVPYYDPTVIYGAWWWPAPPVYWRPWVGYAPAHVRPGVSVGFYWGSGVRIAADFFFGHPDWQRRSVNVVRVNNYYHHHTVVNRGSDRGHAGPTLWRHDPSRRGSIPYRDPAVRQQFEVQQRQAVEQKRHAVEQREQRRNEARRPPQAEVRRGPEARDERDGRGRDGRGRDGRADDNRGDGRRDGRGDARPDRGAGARSDAAPAAIQPSQRFELMQAQQRRQAEELQRQQQQAQRQQAERAQRQQQAERVQREQQQRQAEQVQRQQQEQAQRQQQPVQQRQQQEARRDEPRRDARPAGGQSEERGKGRGRGEGRG